MAREVFELPNLPPELEGAMSDLGEFRAEYRAGWGLLLYLLLGVGVLVFGVGLCLLMVYLVTLGHIEGHLFHGVIIALGLTIGGAFMIYRSVRAWGARVLVFDSAWFTFSAGGCAVFGWHEITSFQEKSPKGVWEKMTQSSYWVMLRRQDGAVLTIDAYIERAKDLGSGIRANWLGGRHRRKRHFRVSPFSGPSRRYNLPQFPGRSRRRPNSLTPRRVTIHPVRGVRPRDASFEKGP